MTVGEFLDCEREYIHDWAETAGDYGMSACFFVEDNWDIDVEFLSKKQHSWLEKIHQQLIDYFDCGGPDDTPRWK